MRVFRMSPFARLGVFLIAVSTAVLAFAQEDVPYRKPPKEILDLADVAPPPRVMVDRDARRLVLLAQPGFKTLEELAESELRLAGLRINPRNHNRSRTRYAVGIEVQEIATGRRIQVTGLPDPVRIEYPSYSPKANRFAFVQVEPQGLSVWTVDMASGRAARVTSPIVSATLASPYRWAPDESALYVNVRPSVEPLPAQHSLPTGPVVQQAVGKKAPGRTYQDLLRSKDDERSFEYYATTEVRRFALDGTSTPVFPPAIYSSVEVSPDGGWILVEELRRPFSYQFQLDRFPYRAWIADRAGREAAVLAEKPLRDQIPLAFDAAETGRRDFQWRDDDAASIVWAEALDGGDPAKDVPHRDRLSVLGAPFNGEPRALGVTRNRFQGITWGEAGIAIVSDSRWKERSVKQYLFHTDRDNPDPKVLFEYSSENLYGLPGDFITAPNARDRWVLLTGKDGSKLYLEGEGYSPDGNRPFIDEYDLKTAKTSRLWRADGVATYEQIVRVLEVNKKKEILTRIQGPKTFPNYFLRRIGSKDPPRPITFLENPFKALDAVTKQKIKYRRADGVDLSADLLLPPGYDPARDGRLPMLMEAYPTEFKDKAAAGMVDSSPHAFVYPSWGSPVFWVLRGYAILEGAQFPIVGEGKAEPNDTYVEQLVANARAAIDAVAGMGIADPLRVAVMGHSYGAFMTVNLLAHSDLFAAGIARSGAYNRSLTPFGFQSEERTYWEAQEVYQKMSPFNYAQDINEPLLLIHGDADNNPGTFTLQSERLFQAIKGLGGRARLVLLPYESHGYAAGENILHLLWEQDTWLETYVKNRKVEAAK